MFKKQKKEPVQEQIRMVYDRSLPVSKKNIINYFRTLGIDVHTETKARGNNGIYVKNRIDVSRNLKEEKAIEVLVHEFSHYIHSKIDADFNKNGGSLEKIFDTKEISTIKKELIEVMYHTDKNSKLEIFKTAKEEVSDKIKGMQKAIKRDYPKFLRSKAFPEFDKYAKNSDAKYLVRYDAIKIRKGFFQKKDIIYSVKHLEEDFPDMPKAFQLYIKLCSLQRKQAKISRRINKMKKYYEKPTELFARYVQGYFKDKDTIAVIAPVTTKQFLSLLKKGYYKELKDFFEIFG